MTLHAPSASHELLSNSLEDLITENRAAAARRQRLLRFFRSRRGEDLTARQETEVEVSCLWAVPASWVRRQLNDAIWVDEYFPWLRDLAGEGRVDPYRVSLIAETARNGLDTEEEYAALVRRLQPFLTRHLRPDGILGCSHKQLRNKLTYEIRTLRAADAEQRFQSAYAHRDIAVTDGEAGISWLTIGGTTDQIQLAAHRLDLSARALRAEGDPRTLEQLKADLAVDLLVNGSTDTSAVPQYARPITNLTVPIQTVMGLSDHPGVLSGGTVIPAALARVIAQRPGGTWHRMLTDPAGKAVELSTERYRPTRAIWEEVVAVQPTCFREGCDKEATACDLDHLVAWPLGPTKPANLQPACRTDHRAKHADGFSIEQTPSGGFALRTAAGFTYPVVEAEHPASTEWRELTSRIQFSATEVHEALNYLREQRAQDHQDRVRRRADLYWEHDLWCGVEFDKIMYSAA